MTRSLHKDIAKVVSAILTLRDLQQKDLAAALGHANSSNVSRWLGGGTFNADTVEDMAEALGMDAEQLVKLAMLSRQINDGELAALLASVTRSSSTPAEAARQDRLTGS